MIINAVRRHAMKSFDQSRWEIERQALRQANVVLRTNDLTIRELIAILGEDVIAGTTEEMLDQHLLNFTRWLRVQISHGGQAIELTRPEGREVPIVYFTGACYPDGTLVPRQITSMPAPSDNTLFLIEENVPILWYRLNSTPVIRHDLVTNNGMVDFDHYGNLIMVDHLTVGKDLAANVAKINQQHCVKQPVVF